MNLPLALLIAVLACVLSDSAWYMMGRRYGGRVLRLLCRMSLEASTCVKKTEGYFTRRGAATLLFAKFVPGLSVVSPPIAGQTGMPYGKFLAADFTGSTLWALSYMLLGRFFGDVVKKNALALHFLGHFAVLIVLLMVIGVVVYRFVKRQQFLRYVREQRLEPQELKLMMDAADEDGSARPFIVDLRHPLDYLPDPRVLPGALRLGPKELETHAEIIPRDRDVVLYCTCPSEETSAKVALQLHKLGIYRVRPLRGGFDGWKLAGFPLEDYIDDKPLLAPLEQILPA
jgi:membrane protein DedA with SNARE-associated domain/rhodanese-related sulfurtransferase